MDYKPSPDEEKKLEKYVKVAWLYGLGYLPILCVCYCLMCYFENSDQGIISYVDIVLFFLYFAGLLSVLLFHYRCPRCGTNLTLQALGRTYGAIKHNNCTKCGLRLGKAS